MLSSVPNFLREYGSLWAPDVTVMVHLLSFIASVRALAHEMAINV